MLDAAPSATPSVGPDDTERLGLGRVPAANHIVQTVLAHFRAKLGREPTVAELDRWGDVYVRAGRGLQQLAATRKALAATEGGKRRAKRRAAEADKPPAEGNPAPLAEEHAVEDGRRRHRATTGTPPTHFELRSALVGKKTTRMR